MRRSRNIDELIDSADVRSGRTERTVLESERIAEASRAQQHEAADQLEEALAVTMGEHDPSITERVSELIAHLRQDYRSDGPLIELIREPIHR